MVLRFGLRLFLMDSITPSTQQLNKLTIQTKCKSTLHDVSIPNIPHINHMKCMFGKVCMKFYSCLPKHIPITATTKILIYPASHIFIFHSHILYSIESKAEQSEKQSEHISSTTRMTKTPKRDPAFPNPNKSAFQMYQEEMSEIFRERNPELNCEQLILYTETMFERMPFMEKCTWMSKLRMIEIDSCMKWSNIGLHQDMI